MTSATTGPTHELNDRAWRVIPGGISSARRRTSPLVNVRRAVGGRVWDIEGREYIDFHQAYSAIILGHSHPHVVESVQQAIEHLVLPGLGVTEGEVELAERLVRHIPSAEQVVLVNSGSEATYNAVRLARAITGRAKVLKFQGCYHGSHDYVLRNRLSVPVEETSPDGEYGGVFAPASEAVVVCRYNDVASVRQAFALHAGEIAAVIVEPIAHNPPNILPKGEFLPALRELTQEHEALLIFDEVITGFRHGLGGYQGICGIVPDITTVGKAMANGFPIAAVVGRRAFMERFATHPDGDVFLGGTYNGHAPGVAAALATLDVLESEPVYEHIFDLGQRMREGLAAIALEADVPAIVSGYGGLYTMLFMDGRLESFDDLERADADLFVRYRRELIECGVIELPIPFVRAQVGYGHSQQDVDRALEAAAEALTAALSSDL